MARAFECDSCGALEKPKTGHVGLEYRVCEGGNSYSTFSPDSHGDTFYLCMKCSASFLAFIKHEGQRGDGKVGVPLFERDAARWRWWCRWWLDEKDDMERINALEYDSDDQDALNAAVDAEIASEVQREGGV